MPDKKVVGGKCRSHDWGKGAFDANIFGGNCRSHDWGKEMLEVNIVGGNCRSIYMYDYVAPIQRSDPKPKGRRKSRFRLYFSIF